MISCFKVMCFNIRTLQLSKQYAYVVAIVVSYILERMSLYQLEDTSSRNNLRCYAQGTVVPTFWDVLS